MKVGLINCSPNYSGIGRYNNQIWKQLHNKINIEKIDFNYLSQGLIVYSKLKNKLNKLLFDYKFFWIWRNQKKIPTCSLYHINTQHLSFLNLRPKIVTCHDLYGLAFPENYFYRILYHWLFSGLAKAEKIIAVSKYTKSELIKYLNIRPEKIKVIYEGVDKSIFKLINNIDLKKFKEKYKLQPRVKYLLHLSNDQKRKNIEGVIKSFYRLKKRLPLEKLQLIKVGKAHNVKVRNKIINLINHLNLSKDIILINEVSDKELAGLYNIAELFVFPSFYEGFGLPVLEAMACGCPVVTSNVTALSEIAGKAALTVNPSDTNSIVEAMKKIIINNKIKEKLIHAGINQVEKFSWKTCAIKTLSVYKECLNENFTN